MSNLTPEEKARKEIDRQLEACGWSVQDYRAMNISAARGVAVREYPLSTGFADYLLYAEGKAIGVVEAKPAGHNLTDVETRQDAASTTDVEAASCRLSHQVSTTRQEVEFQPSKYAQSTFLEMSGASNFEIAFFDPELPVAISSGNLPHWRQEGRTYFVTFRTADSLPREKLRVWQAERDEWIRKNPEPHTDAQKKEYWRMFPERIHEWLDSGFGECLLAQPEIRQIVASAMRHFDGDRYRFHAWVVMPNHVHALLTPLGTNELTAILHSWKSFTATAINRKTGGTGTFWQKESFDHIVRSPAEFERIEAYIRSNPANLQPDTFTLWSDSVTRQDAASTTDVEVASCRLSGEAGKTRQESESKSEVESASRRLSREEFETRQDAVSTIEPASKLLEHVLTERRRIWEAEQLARFEATGITPPKNWKSKYVEPNAPDTIGSPERPE